MAYVFHRTTGEYKSVDWSEAAFPAETWIKNPDVSALSEVDGRYWKADGDNVVEKTDAERLRDVQSQKLREIGFSDDFVGPVQKRVQATEFKRRMPLVGRLPNC